MTDHLSRPAAADFYARNRGGCLFTTSVNQRIGSYLCVPAYRAGLTPTVLTLANLTAGLTAAIVVGTTGAGTSAPHRVVAAVAGFLLWQLAYSFDCADGQLARYTGRTSSAGARLDVLCDAAVQASFATAVCTVAMDFSPGMPDWLAPAFGSAFLVNLFVSSSVESGPAAGSIFVDNDRLPVRLASLLLDHGSLITVFPAAIAFAPHRLAAVMMFFVFLNVALLAVRISKSAWASSETSGMRPPALADYRTEPQRSHR